MIQAQFTAGGRIRHWSDEGYMIRQVETDTLYEDAVDILPCSYNYEETDELISKPAGDEEFI